MYRPRWARGGRPRSRPVGDAIAPPAIIALAASLQGGSATGQPNVTAAGATITATASMQAGSATGGATAAAATITLTASMQAGSTTVEQTAQSGKRALAGGYGWHVLAGAELDYRLDKLNNAGVLYVRSDFRWAEIQPTSSTTNWSSYDYLMAKIDARGMKMLPILMDAPSWAGSSSHTHASPTNLTAWADWCAAVVGRYTSIDAVEIWNEPNIGFWQPTPNTANYTSCLIAAYNAIKAVRPSIQVGAGSFAPAADTASTIAPATFLNGIYSAGGKNYFDFLTNHPYTFDSPSGPDGTESWNPWYIMRTTLRSKMVAEGDSAKKMWLTEFGAPTWSGGVTEAAQASVHYQRAFERARSTEDYIEYIFAYSLKDKLTNDNTDRENHFGLIRDDNTEKPAWTYFAGLTDGGDASTPRQTKLFTPPYAQGTIPAAGTVLTHTLTLDAPAIAGNDIIVFAGIDKKADTTFTPPAGFTEVLKHTTGPSISAALYHKRAVGGEQSISFTTTSTVEHHGATILAQEWSGLAASAVDKSAIAHTNGQNVFSFTVGPTATTAQANEVALLFWCIDSVSVMTSDVSMTGGFVHQATYRTGYSNTSASGIAWGKKILTGTEALSSTMSFSGTIADQTAAIIVTLKQA
jgi:hypothetical protein